MSKLQVLPDRVLSPKRPAISMQCIRTGSCAAAGSPNRRLGEAGFRWEVKQHGKHRLQLCTGMPLPTFKHPEQTVWKAFKSHQMLP